MTDGGASGSDKRRTLLEDALRTQSAGTRGAGCTDSRAAACQSRKAGLLCTGLCTAGAVNSANRPFPGRPRQPAAPLPRMTPLGSSGGCHTVRTDVSLTSGNTSLTGGPGAGGEKPCEQVPLRCSGSLTSHARLRTGQTVTAKVTLFVGKHSKNWANDVGI